MPIKGNKNLFLINLNLNNTYLISKFAKVSILQVKQEKAIQPKYLIYDLNKNLKL